MEGETITVYVRFGEAESRLIERAARHDASVHRWAKRILVQEARARELVSRADVARLLRESELDDHARAVLFNRLSDL